MRLKQKTIKILKKAIFSLILIIAIFSSTVTLGAEPDKFERICNSSARIGQMLAPWTSQIVTGIANTPLGPTPVIGVSQIIATASPFFELCRLYQRMKTLELREAILAAAEITNEVFNNAYTAEMNLLRDSFDIYSNTNNILNHKDPKSKLFTQQYARRLNRFVGSVNTYTEARGGSRIEALNSRQQQERSMRLLVKQASKISKFKSFLKCPKENPINPQVEASYAVDSRRLYDLINQFQADEVYLTAKIRDMGIKINSYQKDLEDYLVEVSGLVVEGVKFNARFREYTEETSFINEEKEESTKDITKTYQVITILQSPELFDKFKEKHGGSWRAYARLNVATSGSVKGILSRGSKRVDDEWSDLFFECRRHRFEYELRRSGNWNELQDDMFDRMVNDRVQTCKKGQSLNQVENILTYFVDQLKLALTLRKQYQAELWTLDSFAFGQVRNINYTPEEFNKTSIPDEQVVCSEKLNNGQLLMVQAELAQLNSESREEVSNIYFERLALKNAERSRQERAEKESARRRLLQAERERRRKVDYSNFVTFPDTGIGL